VLNVAENVWPSDCFVSRSEFQMQGVCCGGSIVHTQYAGCRLQNMCARETLLLFPVWWAFLST
jgi:hypothetical protein